MPKRKFPPIRIDKRKKKLPETSEEFINAGIELEESGDRWRAGDKVKAGRFYFQAIESYEAALQRNSRSFDATYNRARLLYQLAQNPNLLSTPSNAVSKSLLEKAVQSHQECLVLSSDNQDALFNTGQVLCSLAEALVEYRSTSVEARSEALNVLCEAVELFQKCLQVQESQCASFGPGNSNGTRDEGDTNMDADEPPTEPENLAPSGGGQEDEQMSEGSGSDDAQWVIVQTPVTLTQILDTALAQLEAYASLLPLCAVGNLGGKSLSWAQSMGETLLSLKIIPLSQETGREEEAALAKANFRVSLGEASFRAGLTGLAGWEAAIHLAFPNPEGKAQDFQELCDRADAHIQLASTAAEKTEEEEEEEVVANLAWRHYAFAAKSLSAAAKLEPAKSEIHIARGDVEILRAKLGTPAAAKSRDVLAKNAGVYYRGAKRLEGDARIRVEAAVKEAMVAFEGGDGGELLKEIEMGSVAKEVVVEAVDEGLFSAEWLARVST